MRRPSIPGPKSQVQDRRIGPTASPGPRAGLTLVEVLMSMLVTGIGLLSVVSLFPLAFVRSLEATNLTNGTILRYNAESQIYMDQLDLEYVYPKWQPNTAYAANQVVLAATGNNTVRFLVQTAGISGPAEPTWNTTIGGNTTDGGVGGVTWQAVDHSHYVIDPLGWNTMAAAGNGLQTALGNTKGTLGGLGVPPAGTAIERFNAGINAGNANGVAAASQLATLPDSWTEQWRGPVASSTTTSITVNGPDLSGVDYFGVVAPNTGAPGAVPSITSRVVLVDSTGKFSQTRLITQITTPTSSPTISWNTNDPLTGGFTPAQVRLETQDRRYTWILTVQRTSTAPPNVQVAIFFRRSMTANDEQTYIVSSVSSTQFMVNYTNLPRPFVKKGGFLFDVTFGRWYRVIDIPSDTGSQLTVTVDRIRPPADGTLAPPNPNFSAVFMRGVVDVYSFPLKS